jgi:O-antigen/teichoic acid export membrane protein
MLGFRGMLKRWPERNTWASFIGMAGTALIFFVALGWYARELDAFEFACVGLFLTLSAIVLALDGGAAQGVNRELAMHSATEHGQTRLQVCFLQLLKYCLLLTTGIAIVLFLLLPWMATHWLRIPMHQLNTLHAIAPLMALACAIQVPLAFHTQAMQGLSLHVLCNTLNVIFLALRFFGAGALILVIPNDHLEIFFAWHLAISTIHLFMMHLNLLSKLPHGQEETSDPELWPRVIPFLRDMTALSIVTMIITQIDKVIISRLVPFDQYGYYVMIASLASVLVRVAQPLFALSYPRMTQAVARNDAKQLTEIYRQSFKWLLACLVTVLLFFFFFASPLISWYSQKPDLMQTLALPLQLLALGYAANALMHIPFALTLAHGWARFALIQNIIAAIALIPIIWTGILVWGIPGAALGWCIVNLAYLLISMPIIERHCLAIPRKPLSF